MDELETLELQADVNSAVDWVPNRRPRFLLRLVFRQYPQTGTDDKAIVFPRRNISRCRSSAQWNTAETNHLYKSKLLLRHMRAQALQRWDTRPGSADPRAFCHP